jgi:competence protein ComFC
MTHPGCKTRYSLDGTFVGLDYNPVMKKLIYQFKYKPYLSDLNKFLSELLYEAIIQKEDFAKLEKQNFLIVPIPLFDSRKKIRGYNQSELLAKELAKKLNLKFLSLITRIKETKTQVGQTKKQRRENLAGAFALSFGKQKTLPFNIFLVDDILTTGATFNSAANTLKRGGVGKVFGIALAKER